LDDIIYMNRAKFGFKGHRFGKKDLAKVTKDFRNMVGRGNGRCSYEEFHNDIEKNVVQPLRNLGFDDAYIVEAINSSLAENKDAFAWAATNLPSEIPEAIRNVLEQMFSLHDRKSKGYITVEDLVYSALVEHGIEGKDVGTEFQAKCRKKLQTNFLAFTHGTGRCSCDQFCRNSYMEYIIDCQSETEIFEAVSSELDKNLQAYAWGKANLPQ
jgi:hypothetical protein